LQRRAQSAKKMDMMELARATGGSMSSVVGSFYNAGVLYFYYLLVSAKGCSHLPIKFDNTVTVIS